MYDMFIALCVQKPGLVVKFEAQWGPFINDVILEERGEVRPV